MNRFKVSTVENAERMSHLVLLVFAVERVLTNTDCFEVAIARDFKLCRVAKVEISNFQRFHLLA